MGFWLHEDNYLLYFRPSVSYGGTDPRLREFFDRGAVQRYSSFEDMARCLHSLDQDAAVLQPSSTAGLFLQLQHALQGQVLGQEEAVEAAAFKLWGHVCKQEPMRPLSLIFYGPTGVGKSELGKTIAPTLNRCLAENRYRLVWTELNTFTQAHSVYRLTGAPPGYVGYDDSPVLEAVRQCPHTVFMFDELDKAHPEVLKVFMSILDEGRCTARREDKQGNRELDFRRCIFLFTTNTDLSGAACRPLGFVPPQCHAVPTIPAPTTLAHRLYQADESARMALIRSGVLREIAGRFSGLIGFHPLSPEAKEAITAKQITALGREYGLNIVRVSPVIARALTPDGGLSLRSSVPMLEGMLTPIFLAHAAQSRQGPVQLSGTPGQPILIPA